MVNSNIQKLFDLVKTIDNYVLPLKIFNTQKDNYDANISNTIFSTLIYNNNSNINNDLQYN
jgi:hypothetical protein